MRPSFDFIGRKYYWFALSAIIIAAGLVALLAKGLNFGIDFEGGTVMNLMLSKPASVREIRGVLAPMRLADSQVQVAGVGSIKARGKEVLIRTRQLTPVEQVRLRKALDNKFGVNRQATQIQTVGPGWGANVTRSAILALTASLLLIIIYISLRFEWKMAFAAVAALFHDLLITVGVYAITGREVTPNTIAAILTILGYSLYDTMVIFHRINQNSERMGKRTYSMMADDSINQVLMRWINTSLVQLIPVTSLLIFGGDTLKDFAFALLVGLISGAYSSVFFASPVLCMLKETEPRFRMLRKKYGNIQARA